MRLQSRGKRVHGRYFLAAYSSKAKSSRVGITVSKKVSKRAVHRNRIKRVVKEYFRHDKLPLELVLIAKPGSEAVENSVLREDLESIWRKLARIG